MLKQAPKENMTFRNSLYEGKIYLLPSNAISQAIVNEVKSLIQKELGFPIRQAHLFLDDALFFKKIGALRRQIYCEATFQKPIFSLLENLGFEKEKIAIDPFRLRVVKPYGHINARAAPVYYPHRDTWYAHPQSTLVLWLPLDDLKEEETFEFYPDYFNKAVPNNSAVFNYDNWIKEGPELKIGWQDINSGKTAVYPSSDFNEMENRLGFSCSKAEILFFSGQHYHKTKPQTTKQIRYSLDVRFVHLDDVEKKAGPQNVDNYSTGNILKDYFTFS